MNCCGRVGRLILAVWFSLGLSALRSAAQELSSTDFPVEAYKKNDKGIVVAQVKFAADGKVDTCIIVRSNVPYPLEAATVDYIKRKWINDLFAGETVLFPITFDELPWYATHWNDDLVPPPNILPLGDPGRSLKLRIAFGKDSWVEHVQVIQPSGLQLVDVTTARWVKVHWHNEAFSGQTLDTPFVFKPRPVPKAPVAVKRKPVAAEPAKPAEPASLPAVRVQ
jgi:hypothetical protein